MNGDSLGLHRYRTPGVYLEKTLPIAPPEFLTGVPVFVGFIEDSGPGKRRGVEFVGGHWEEEWHQIRDRWNQARKAREEPNQRSEPPEGRAQLSPGACHLARWEQFESLVGQPHRGSYLDYAVRGFFENGGRRCAVVPLRMEQRDPLGALREAFEVGGLLDEIEDADLVCVPDAMMDAVGRSPEGVYQVQRSVLEHCHRMGDRFAVLDAVPPSGRGHEPGSSIGAAVVQTLVDHWRALLPIEGALYFPWIRVEARSRHRHVLMAARTEQSATAEVGDVENAVRDHRGILVPACGHVAGIYARSDMRIGVHKPPANEVVEGALDLEMDVTDQDQGALNQIGVNCLRSILGRGIRVWGARTLSRHAAGRYINVQRLFLTFARWAKHNFDDLIFEPNGPALWERVRFRLCSYCQQLFERGALKGSGPAEAYYVKCDAETNPREAREAGRMVAEIGLAPVAPAEFVIVHITQTNAGVSVSVPASA